ncbi:MAG: hypothetical protein WEF86_03720 [Gemmatimonadota bacterium]
MSPARRRACFGFLALLLWSLPDRASGMQTPVAQPTAGILPGAVGATGEVRGGDVVIRFWPGQRRLAESLLPERATPGFIGMPFDIFGRGGDIVVMLAPDAARFDSLTGGRTPEWGAGVAMPRLGIIVIPGYVSDRTGTHTLQVTLRHELAHVALQRHLGDAIVPRWFTEGYATWAAGEFDEQQGWMLRLALATGRAPPLDSLTLDWPLIAADARLAYMLSASAVRYLHSLGPPNRFERFMDDWATSGSFEQSLREVYVVSSAQFERLWRTHVRRRYGWLQVIAQTLFVWTVLAAVVLALSIVRRRRNRRRMERMREQEPPDEPAYWMNDGEQRETNDERRTT